MRALIKLAIIVIVMILIIKIIFNFIDDASENLSNNIYRDINTLTKYK
jgi:hypothetical protein